MVSLRDADEKDVPAILEIANDAIRTSDTIWTETLLTFEQRHAWLATRQAAGWPVVVATDDEGSVLGFASYGPFRAFEGYALTVEHSVYVAFHARRQGIGGLLLDELLSRAEMAGLHVMIGAITASNVASIALHRRAGFETSSVLPELGRKFGRWLDLVFMYRLLDSDTH
ncbi:acetyltransferase [Neoasaia chiangmaiensis NBRC 101099]|uniref:Acetyltransferase n=1 Tax=Neoasaia chiangmaiensis TaxID=320497 RepID=A0A1U9KMA9_9PROT|nr:GNAT family N-acetyltransferase [Neoasaia chiangmaiensis]AQS86934.1 acetyltransferase [Neoasaia chiangmaiensis]GBR37621.1 acetyltransferase [Neoasaia chiangmaiensis NBRC 101099]GEN15039.1 N-acetyltransferase [Neoasaia chiangmaiensis]